MARVACRVDGVAFELQEPFDFGFLRRYGRAFRVWDDQDSGNICFGMEADGQRRFVKVAGPRTVRGSVPPETAVANLRATVPLYEALRHEHFIDLVEAREAPGGFAMAFRWEEGDCMGRMYPASRARFMAMPLESKEAVFAAAGSFLAHVAACGYVAIDFYDGSILHDAASGRTVICDADYYRRTPCVNDMGRMWGSARFQAPEEFRLGAALDEQTNVYTLGALAFELFADGARGRERWPLSQARHEAALRAVRPERERRQASIGEFLAQWEAACGRG